MAKTRAMPDRSTADVVIEITPQEAATLLPYPYSRKAELLLQMQGWYGYTRDEDGKRFLLVARRPEVAA